MEKRFFNYTYTCNWIESQEEYEHAFSHKELAEKLPLKNKRVNNERYREIERTGEYYRITEVGKGGNRSFLKSSNEKK